MHKLALIGNPVTHSLSPKLFEEFARQCNINLTYDKILATSVKDFTTKVDNFFEDGGLALNITSPFKHHAYLIATNHTTYSAFCKTANLLYKNDTEQQNITAHTTDGYGLLYDMTQNLHTTLYNKNILIIGSGFVVDSILMNIILENPKQLSILARNIERVEHLQQKFAINIYNPQVEYDIIINSSINDISNLLFDKISLIKTNALCYDLSYLPTVTLFHQKMLQKNPHINIQNGFGMLVAQAKIAFELLFNQKLNIKNIIRNMETQNNE